MGGLISPKFLVVLVIALIVLGPEKLPEATRTLGRWVTELRRITTGFSEEVRSAFEGSELAEPVQELRSATQTLRGSTADLRGAATGWLTGASAAGVTGQARARVPEADLPSETVWSAPGQRAGAAGAGAVGTTAGIAPARPEAELGIPPGDPSLN